MRERKYSFDHDFLMLHLNISFFLFRKHSRIKKKNIDHCNFRSPINKNDIENRKCYFVLNSLYKKTVFESNI